MSTIIKYNDQVKDMIREARRYSTDSKMKWEAFLESLKTPYSFALELSNDPIARKQALLSLIDHFVSQNEQIKEFTRLKRRVNDNSEKMYVLRDIIGLPQNPHHTLNDEQINYNPSESTATFGAYETQIQEEESLEKEVAKLEDHGVLEGNELRILRTRNQLIEKEIKKAEEQLVGQDNQDSTIESLSKQLKDMTEELALLQGLNN